MTSSNTDTIAKSAIAASQDTLWLRRCEQWRGLHELLQDRHREQTYQSARWTHPEASKVWSEGDGSGYIYMPIVRMYAERLSVAFDAAPATYLRRKGTTERLPESDPQVRQWRQDARDVRLGATLQTVEEMTTALGQAVLSPTWVGDKMRWRVHAPYEIAVLKGILDPDEFSSSRAVAIQIRTAEGGVGQCDWLVWSPTSSALYDYGGRFKASPLFEGGQNGYGRLPLVLWQWHQPPSGEVFCEPDEALLQLARKVNVHMTDLSHGMTYQVHPQAVCWGNPEGIQDGAVITGPDVLVKFTGRREAGDYEFRTPTLNIGELRSTINYWLQTFAITKGLPPDTFLPDSSTRNLGAKQEEAAELQRLRRRRYPVIMDAMRETFDVHRSVGNYWARHGANRIEYADDIELEIELAPISRVEDRQAAAQASEMEIARGQTSTISIVQQATGVTRDEAIASVARNLADEQSAREAAGLTDAVEVGASDVS